MKDDVTVASFDRLAVFMRRSGLRYEVNFVPWARVLRKISENDHALVFQIVRTSQREDDYHWLVPILDSNPLHLYGLESPDKNPDVWREIREGKRSAACHRDSVHCTVLEEMGFPPYTILRISSEQPALTEQLLLRKRVDFILRFKESLCNNLILLNLDARLFHLYKTIEQKPDYLAAPKNINPDILKILQQVDMSDLPPLKFRQVLTSNGSKDSGDDDLTCGLERVGD
ncbi:hypothetical protein GCM10017044_12410 [Kordiimonas sediminis]|uniref:Solute-binding protein family 3/N-terminal domain-containing protein n=1 Tax=Kordiimonas sediminis TaxID=1735581 RepID=A0A919AS38_9PROT|nr:hypothetical protein GCM10017044_12410 [Kordiimonas sediminis]